MIKPPLTDAEELDEIPDTTGAAVACATSKVVEAEATAAAEAAWGERRSK